MARIRTIKPEFWESESTGRLSMGARLLFLASLNLADDEGILRWNEAYLMSQAFVYDELNTEQVSEWMRELVDEQMVFPYKAGKTNQRLGWIINFRRHQVINRPQPSKLPHPSLQSAPFKAVLAERDSHICHLCSLPTDDTAPTNECNSKAPSIDHVIPVSKGGSDYPSNLKLSHISCNKSRGNKALTDSMNDSVNDSVAEWNGMEGERKGDSAEPPSDSVQDENELPIITLLLKDNSNFPVYQNQVEKWRTNFPAVDVMQELRNMHGWCDSNPSKRKTAAGTPKFINGWLTKAQKEVAKVLNFPAQQQAGDGKRKLLQA